jgi:putative copper resistance protein D
MAVLLAAVLLARGRTTLMRLDAASIVVLVVSLGFAGSLAWSGHAGATPGAEGYVHLGADILHVVAAAAWLGGLAPLLWLLCRLERDGQGAGISIGLLQRFSSLGVVSVAALAATGVANSWFMVGSLYALTHTDYGTLLLLKLALFVAMVSLAALNRLLLMPRLMTTAKASGRGSDELAIIGGNALLEFLLGLAVVAVVAGLGVAEPAVHQFHVH